MIILISGALALLEAISVRAINWISLGNLFLERRNTDQYGRRSIQFYGVILWNSIPSEIRNLTTTGCFRTELKKHYISFYVV